MACGVTLTLQQRMNGNTSYDYQGNAGAHHLNGAGATVGAGYEETMTEKVRLLCLPEECRVGVMWHRSGPGLPRETLLMGLQVSGLPSSAPKIMPFSYLCNGWPY
jgi:hypothetical protein